MSSRKFYVAEDFPAEVNQLLEGRIREILPLPGNAKHMVMYEISLEGFTPEDADKVAKAFMERPQEIFDWFISPQTYYESSRFNPDVAAAWRVLLNQIKSLPKDAVVLNFSSGPATHMDKLVERFPRIGAILFCDVSSGQLQIAKEVVKKLPKSIEKPVFPYSFANMIEMGVEGMPNDVLRIIKQNGGVDLVVFTLAEMYASPEDLAKLMSRFDEILKRGGQIVMISSDYKLSPKAGFSELSLSDRKLYIVWLPLPLPQETSVKEFPDEPNRWRIGRYHKVPTVSYPKHRDMFGILVGDQGMTAEIIEVFPDHLWVQSWLKDWTAFSKLFQTLYLFLVFPIWWS